MPDIGHLSDKNGNMGILIAERFLMFTYLDKIILIYWFDLIRDSYLYFFFKLSTLASKSNFIVVHLKIYLPNKKCKIPS